MRELPLRPGEIAVHDVTMQLGLPNTTMLQLTRSARQHPTMLLCAGAVECIWTAHKMRQGQSWRSWLPADGHLLPSVTQGQQKQSVLCRRYAQAPGAVGGLLVTYELTNLDPFNAIEIGSLSLPLVFQVRILKISLQEQSVLLF